MASALPLFVTTIGILATAVPLGHALWSRMRRTTAGVEKAG
jgi:hypothetical protein